MLKLAASIDVVHVPYKGAGPALTDLMGGQVQAMLTDLPPAVPQVKGGKLLGLAIAADQRSPALPDTPTFREAGGTPFVSRSWYGFLVRSGTPPDIVRVLQSEIVKALHNPGLKDKLRTAGMDTYGTSAEEYQVSSTSSSRLSAPRYPAAVARARASASIRACSSRVEASICARRSDSCSRS